MKKATDHSKWPDRKSSPGEKPALSGYPLYPPEEDIYSNDQVVEDINPEDLSRLKAANGYARARNENELDDDFSGDDLDVPGSELDDREEEIGSEDEENNYYSLGGDDHNDLDEEKDE